SLFAETNVTWSVGLCAGSPIHRDRKMKLASRGLPQTAKALGLSVPAVDVGDRDRDHRMKTRCDFLAVTGAAAFTWLIMYDSSHVRGPTTAGRRSVIALGRTRSPVSS